MIKKRHHFLQLVFVDCHKVTCWVCVFKEAALEGISETSSQEEHLCQRSKCSLVVVAVLLLDCIPESETLVKHHLPVLGEKDADTCAKQTIALKADAMQLHQRLGEKNCMHRV